MDESASAHTGKIKPMGGKNLNASFYNHIMTHWIEMKEDVPKDS